jgi:hypothetical protein
MTPALALLLKILLIAFFLCMVLAVAGAVRAGRRRMYPPADPFAAPFGDVVHLPRSAAGPALRQQEAGGGTLAIPSTAAVRTFEDDCPRCGVTESSCTCSHPEPSKRWPR